jgi:hypothetical protein
MAMIATRISGDSRCHFAVRISTSVAAEACAGELPRRVPRRDRFAGAGFSSSVLVAASGAAAASRGLPDWRTAPLASIRPTSSAACSLLFFFRPFSVLVKNGLACVGYSLVRRRRVR